MTDFTNYVEFQKGTIPLIISIPHGGTIKLKDIPERNNGVLGIDKYTIQLGKELIKEIELAFKKKHSELKKPYYVISKIHRSRIDINRKKEKAFLSSSELAGKIYDLYHNKLNDYVNNSIQTFGRSILLDIHGYETEKRPKGYRDVDVIFGTNNLKSLIPYSIPKKDWDKNIRGRLIKNLLELDIPIAPGHPRRREYVLKGGFITKKYGVQNIDHNQTIQIEFSDRIRVHNLRLQKQVLKRISKVLVNDIVNQ
ncbi:MAG: hypothetical protein BAJALOKI3v1_70056 [Promethearchaeota archaeon]|jgi:hypothetical protein|nr:MAG: hypothetical protein BAJALOKI3v1_70056 [Candidatus Lokiarchaeota archaeon]